MTRILDERDKSEIKQEMQTKNELLNQKMVAEDNAIKETMKAEDNAIKATMKAEDDKIYNKIKNEDDAIKVTMAEEDQVLDDKIQDLTTDTTNKFTDLNKKVDDNQEDMATKVDTLGENLTSQIGTLSQNMNTQINDLDNAKVDKDGDKVLSENDLTDELKVNYDASYEHSQQAHAPSNAEMNVQANWAEQDSTSDSYIQNKPTLGAMAAKNVVERSDLSEAVQTSLALADASIQATDLILRTSDGYVQYSTNGETWNNLMPVAELSGFNLHTDDDGVLYFG